MDPEKVHIVRAQAFQRALQSRVHVLRSIAACVHALARGKSGLGSNYDLFTKLSLGDELAQHLFTAPGRVYVRRIYEIAACFHVSVEDGGGTALLQ